MTSVALLNRDIAAKRAERMQPKELKSESLFSQEPASQEAAPFDVTSTSSVPASAPKTGDLLDAPNPAMFVAPDLNQSLARFMLPDTAIAKMREEFLPLTIAGIDDKAGFKKVDQARKLVKGHRCDVEKTRKDLKAEALKFGQAVDAEAKRITAMLEPIEVHLETEQRRVTDELARIAREKEEAERLKAEEEARKLREAEEARIRAEHEAEEKRLAAEREKLETERREQAERDRVEREKIDAERRELDEQRRKLEAEKKRLADEEAERLRIERVREDLERKRVADEQHAAVQRELKEQQEREAAAKREAARPDIEKIRALKHDLLAIALPEVQSQEARAFIDELQDDLNRWAKACAIYE